MQTGSLQFWDHVQWAKTYYETTLQAVFYILRHSPGKWSVMLSLVRLDFASPAWIGPDKRAET